MESNFITHFIMDVITYPWSHHHDWWPCLALYPQIRSLQAVHITPNCLKRMTEGKHAFFNFINVYRVQNIEKYQAPQIILLDFLSLTAFNLTQQQIWVPNFKCIFPNTFNGWYLDYNMWNTYDFQTHLMSDILITTVKSLIQDVL